MKNETINANNNNVELITQNSKKLDKDNYKIEKIVLEKKCDAEYLYQKILPYTEEGYEIIEMKLNKSTLVVTLGKPIKVEEKIFSELPYGLYIDKKTSLKIKYSKLGYILNEIFEKDQYEFLEFQLK